MSVENVITSRRGEKGAPFGPRSLTRRKADSGSGVWVGVFLVIGIAGCLWRDVLHFPLRGDEAMLALNLLDFPGFKAARGTVMHYNQVAPPLFLMISQALRMIFGGDERVLRLAPLFSGIGAMGGFAFFVRRNLKGLAAAVAMGLMAVSFNTVMDAADFKPYAMDLLFGVVYLALGWRLLGISRQAVSGGAIQRRARGISRRLLWGLLLIGPLSVGLSFPAVLLFGGISLMLLSRIWQAGKGTDWAIYVAANLLSGTAFLWAISPTFTPEYRALDQTMQQFWQSGFPGHGMAGTVVWFWQANAKAVFGYPFKSREWVGAIMIVLAVVGIGVLLLRRQQRLLGLLLVPFGLTVLAAILHKYPYGGDTRLAQHLAPAVFVLVGLGTGAIFEGWRKIVPAWSAWSARGLLAGMLLIAPVRMVHDWRHPYLRPADNGPALDVAARTEAETVGERVRATGGAEFYSMEAEANVPSVFNWYLQNQVSGIQWEAAMAQNIVGAKRVAFFEMAYPEEMGQAMEAPAGWKRSVVVDGPFFLEKGGTRRVCIYLFEPLN